jgi:hypothetical protein
MNSRRLVCGPPRTDQGAYCGPYRDGTRLTRVICAHGRCRFAAHSRRGTRWRLRFYWSRPRTGADVLALGKGTTKHPIWSESGRVEMCRGFFRSNISVSGPFVCGALVVRPWLRFHIPLIEPDMQISCINLVHNI